MINVVVFYGFQKSPQYKTHPEFGITFLYWSQKLSLKKVRLQLGVLRYNNKILISSPSFKIGMNVKINLDVKSKKVEMVKTKPDVKAKVITKPNIEPNEKRKQDVKPNIKLDRESNQDVKKPDTNKITYEEEKVALILGTTAVFTVWWMFK